MNFPKTPSFSLENKRALITGAGRGLVWCFYSLLRRCRSNDGFKNNKELEEIYNHLKQLGHKSSYKSLDVTNQNDISKLINDENCFDILVNNAGTNIPSSLVDTKLMISIMLCP